MVARLMGRERKLPAPCTPAHAPHLIGYTTTRDAIKARASPGRRACSATVSMKGYTERLAPAYPRIHLSSDRTCSAESNHFSSITSTDTALNSELFGEISQ
ncbi:hypothetical protein ACVW19_005062 [Streptomyces sp. TE5632]